MSPTAESPDTETMADASDTVPQVTAREGDNSNVPKPKRLACMICRKRKLKCDGVKPSCSTCTRLGHSCAYDEVRRKSGPKRGYVKALEERLKQVETLLKTQEPGSTSPETSRRTPMANIDRSNEKAAAKANFGVTDPSIAITNSRDMDRWHFNAEESPTQPGSIDDFNFNSNISMNMNNVDSNFTWEIINLGLEEPLPPQETIDELHQIYFEKVHPSLPMIHKYRYLAAMNLAPNQRPPVCLRYAMWTQACSVTDKYGDLKDLFYQRARKYVETDYMKGYGEHLISVAHCQTHVLLAAYEFKMMYFPRAWMSTGQAVRLAQMMGLHRLDGSGLDVKQCLPPPRDWTEREERRRTFWMAFCKDRYASIGTGWPMTVDEKDILTNLPSSEDAFDMSRPEQMVTLSEAMSPAGAGKLSSFGGIVLLACLFGRNLIHLHRPDIDDRDNDLNGEFWKRHRNLDNILLNTSLCLPSYLKLPSGLQNPNNVFTNMCIHTSTICLHQAAIFKADKNRLPAAVSGESKVRCITAANEIASIMRMVSHMDLSAMNPFISFCLYVAARVFVQYLKSRPEDSQTADSLRFLLAAMNALKRKNPLTESFLVQLDVDLEALGSRIPKLKSAFPRSGDSPSSGAVVPPMARPGANCEDGPTGIMNYRNDLHYKPNDDDTNGVDDGSDKARHPVSVLGNGIASWLGAEQALPTRDRSSAGHSPVFPMQDVAFSGAQGLNLGLGGSSGTLSGFGASENGESQHTGSGTSPDGPSNRPTPNSSAASDHHQRLAPGGAAGGGGGGGRSGRGSFEASPAASGAAGGAAAATVGPGDLDRGGGFYSASGGGGFGMGGTGMTPGNEYALPPGWGEMGGGGATPGATGMTRLGEGVLRTIMQMGPMETMDLGWDSNA